MPTVIEELVIALKYETDDKQLKAARDQARKVAGEISRAFELSGDDIEDSAEDAAKANKKAAKATSEVWKGALRQVGASLVNLAGAGAKALLDFGKDTAESIRQVQLLADQTGGSVEELQALRVGFNRLGIDNDKTNEGIKTFQENLGELARLGTGPAKDALGSLGLTLNDFAGLGVEERLGVFSDALLALEDPTKQLSIAIEVMGEDGAKLLPALKQGAAGIGELTKAARESGQVLDDEAIARTRELDKAIRNIEGEFKGVALTILTDMLPAFESAAADTKAWIDENEELIKQDLPQVASDIAAGFGVVADAVGGLIGLFNDARQAADDFATALSDSVIQEAEARERAGLILTQQGLVAQSGRQTNVRGVAGLGGSFGRRAQLRAGRQAAQDEALSAELGSIAADVDARVAFAQRNARLQAGQEFAAAELASQDKSAKGAAKRRGGRGRKTEDPALIAARLAVSETGLEDEIRRLGQRTEASTKAVATALEASAKSLASGASRGVALRAGRGALGKLVGQDLNKAPTTDPLLAELFGSDQLPDAPLSDLTQNRQPQVLTATINNTFTITQSFDIDGAGRPELVAENVTDRFRELFDTEIQRASKFAKVNFAR